jgi:hypothetical protein
MTDNGNSERPWWWPENPYPEDIFPMTIDEYVAAIPDPHLRTAISGCLARFGWRIAETQIWDAWQRHMVASDE